MTPEMQEALSRKYSDDVVMILRLKGGLIAVFNAAREVCGFVENPDQIMSVWYPPADVRDLLRSISSSKPKTDMVRTNITRVAEDF